MMSYKATVIGLLIGITISLLLALWALGGIGSQLMKIEASVDYQEEQLDRMVNHYCINEKGEYICK